MIPAMKPLDEIFVVDLSRVLSGPVCTMLMADMGAEVLKVEAPPLGLWLAYRLWEEDPAADDHWLAQRYAGACDSIGLSAQRWPSIAELAELAAPYLPASFRGGYGHVEVGLAVHARLHGRVHGVVSLKSFGCITSAGVSDGIVPYVLGDSVDFLALEISEDAVAARESRVMLLIARVRQRASRMAFRPGPMEL